MRGGIAVHLSIDTAASPYVVTIIVVAGLVGKVRGPKAEGVPYVKS